MFNPVAQKLVEHKSIESLIYVSFSRAGTIADGSPSGASAGAFAAAGNAIVHNEATTINKNVINSLVRSTQTKVGTTSSSIAPLVDLATVRLGRSIFASNGVRRLANVINYA